MVRSSAAVAFCWRPEQSFRDMQPCQNPAVRVIWLLWLVTGEKSGESVVAVHSCLIQQRYGMQMAEQAIH
jgi:hypothetical protein